MSLKHFGLKKLEGEQEVTCLILKSLCSTAATIGLRSRAISIAKVSLRLKDLENIIQKNNCYWLTMNGLEQMKINCQFKKLKKEPFWKQMQPPYQIGKDGFIQKDLKKDYDDWVDAQMYLPISYDLVHMKMERKTVPGWWNGIHWEGLRMLSEDKVLFWKKRKEEVEE